MGQVCLPKTVSVIIDNRLALINTTKQVSVAPTTMHRYLVMVPTVGPHRNYNRLLLDSIQVQTTRHWSRWRNKSLTILFRRQRCRSGSMSWKTASRRPSWTSWSRTARLIKLPPKKAPPTSKSNLSMKKSRSKRVRSKESDSYLIVLRSSRKIL